MFWIPFKKWWTKLIMLSPRHHILQTCVGFFLELDIVWAVCIWEVRKWDVMYLSNLPKIQKWNSLSRVTWNLNVRDLPIRGRARSPFVIKRRDLSSELILSIVTKNWDGDLLKSVYRIIFTWDRHSSTRLWWPSIICFIMLLRFYSLVDTT